MYVCICRGFNEDEVRQAACGRMTVSQIYDTLGGRPSCGKCVGMVRDIVRDAVAESAHSDETAAV